MDIARRRTARRDPLGTARRQFERWRGRGSPGKRIPEELWQAASEAARAHGVSRTARDLGLNHTVLKKRLKTASRTRSSSSGTNGVEFLSLPPVAVARATAECLIEIEDRRGTRLRVELGVNATSELASIVRLLWESRA